MELKEIYRIQHPNIDQNPLQNVQYPVKRVIVSDSGKIVLNPDSQQFIYFSRSKKHHAYYLFSKVFKIICNEIKKAQADPYLSKLDLPEDFRVFKFHSQVNVQAIKQVKNLFENYLPPKKVELVTLQYLNAFSQLFEKCATKNSKKQFGKNYPEISDTNAFGGAYGINDLWLELLQECIVSSEVSSISIPRLLDELVSCKYKITVGDQRLKSILSGNAVLFEVMDHITRKKLINPEFKDKNTPNNIANLLNLIEENHMYPPTLQLDKTFFATERKKFKDEYRDTIITL